jgi:serine/threonine protein kinase
LGKGTYGKVKLALDKRKNEQVAIKTIKKSRIENPHDLARIRREIDFMTSLNHPYIIKIKEGKELFSSHRIFKLFDLIISL